MKNLAASVIGLVVALTLLLVTSTVFSSSDHFGSAALVSAGFAIGWITSYIRFVFVEHVDDMAK
jgi:hypothetical protein